MLSPLNSNNEVGITRRYAGEISVARGIDEPEVISLKDIRCSISGKIALHYHLRDLDTHAISAGAYRVVWNASAGGNLTSTASPWPNNRRIRIAG